MGLFRKILIANRGEIAIRVARTCRAMGIPTLAIFSSADRTAPHVREADEAVPIGPPEPSASYLNIEGIVSAGVRAGADAVHPGYGFLSQNAEFADAVARAGMTFIGPPARVHRQMGDKKTARRMMAGAGVPVIAGYDGDDQADETLASEAARLGWPVMIKPSRGGGGKGMRIVTSPEGFPSALAASRREARSAFGDEVVILERYIQPSRHVEVQILADAFGDVVHLFERECSIQRRHQKIVEEAPSPGLDPGRQEALCAAAVAAARAVGYLNAGTVEFLLDPGGGFYFIEMNTRLQVEHPVTEAVTNLDLVRLQISVAAGKRLSLRQEDIVRHGHALECRVYAEDPDTALPSAGRILHLFVSLAPGVRFDSGVAEGSEVGLHYDPLLAKIVTWGADRTEAMERMRAALKRTVVLGVKTNLPRLGAILSHPAFADARLHTGFIEEHLPEGSPDPPPRQAVAAAVAALSLKNAAREREGSSDPWESFGPWRLGTRPRRE